jgi:CRP-like cAMP-binding protein
LPDNQLGELAGIAIRNTFARGQTIFTEGEHASGFYVLVSGRVKVFKLSTEGKEQVLHIIQGGEPFGEVAVFTGSKFPAHAEAIEKSVTLFFPRMAFMKLIEKDPSLAMNMLALLSFRLKRFAQLVENLSLKEVPQRFAAYLLYLSETKGGTLEVELDVSKALLASLLGTIPETLSRILNRMALQGLIEVQGRKIRLLARNVLADLASGEKDLL